MNPWLVVLITAVAFVIISKVIDRLTRSAPRRRRIARRVEFAFLLVLCAGGSVLIGLGYGDQTDAVWPALLGLAMLAHPPERFKTDARADPR